MPMVKDGGLDGFHVVVSLIIFYTLLKITVESIGISNKSNNAFKRSYIICDRSIYIYFLINVIKKIIAIVKYRCHREST